MIGHPFTIKLEHEQDGRWTAEIAELPGVLAFGQTRAEAMAAAESIAMSAVMDLLAPEDVLPLTPPPPSPGMSSRRGLNVPA